MVGKREFFQFVSRVEEACSALQDYIEELEKSLDSLEARIAVLEAKQQTDPLNK